MMFKRTVIAAAIFMMAMLPAMTAGADPLCPEPGETEEVLYTWRLRGGLAWIAGIAFPTSGIATLKTTQHPDSGVIETSLYISDRGSGGDFYEYASEIQENGLRTVMSLHGYSWGRKYKQERTRLDYSQKRATTIKKSYKTDVDRTQTEAISGQNLRDILTGIYYLRAKAGEIEKPIETEIYSDGKLYPVLYKPLGSKTYPIAGKKIAINGFEISARPGDENKWPGGVEVWVTSDSRSIPVKITINQTFARMELDLASAACGTDRILLSRR